MRVNLKYLVGAGLVTFFIISTAIIAAGLLHYQANKDLQAASKVSSIPQSGQQAQNTHLAANTLTMTDVAKHNSFNDCWMVINGKVYDLTSFLPDHPGSAPAMLPYCGKDGSAAYVTKDKSPGRTHSNEAQALLGSYYVADLVSGAVASQGSDSGAVAVIVQSGAQQTKPNASVPAEGRTVTLSAEEIAKHNSASDCWMIINGKVYDFSGFLPQHPGSAGAMVPYCGMDGSAAYASKDKSPGTSHSSAAQSLLAGYYLGDLSQTLSQSVVDNRVNQSNSNTAAIPRGDIEDDEIEQEFD